MKVARIIGEDISIEFVERDYWIEYTGGENYDLEIY